MGSSGLRVVVAGGGIAGVEGLLALRDLAGDRVALTLVTPDDHFRLRPFAVAEPFGLGRPHEVPHSRIAEDAGAEWIRDSVAEVDDSAGRLRTAGGATIEYDALLLALGGRMVDAVDHALTWRPEAAGEIFGGLLRDVEEGYSRRVAFIVPAGPVWPLPAYELALMTSRHGEAMGIRAEITIVTPEREPLAFFGRRASGALADALDGAGVRLVTGAVGHVERRPRLHVVLEPSQDTFDVDRVVAMPALRGPTLSGVAQDEMGFITTGGHGLVEGCDRTWAAGDGIASPLKLGGLATHQARRAARDIAVLAGAASEPGEADSELVLDGVLMTGATPVPLDDRRLEPAAARPLWWPSRKVAGRYIGAYVEEGSHPASETPSETGVRVEVEAREIHDLTQDYLYTAGRQPSSDEIARLGKRMHEYERDHP